MSQFFDIPPGHTVCSSLHTVFSHYSTPWRSEIVAVDTTQGEPELSMDQASFFRMCKEIPNLMDPVNSVEFGLLRRKDIDLIFVKCTQVGSRRMEFPLFLEALLLIARKIYPHDNPTNAFTKLLVHYIYGAFDHNAVAPNPEVFQRILTELGLSSTNASAESAALSAGRADGTAAAQHQHHHAMRGSPVMMSGVPPQYQ